jgi:hypothetical protein
MRLLAASCVAALASSACAGRSLRLVSHAIDTPPRLDGVLDDEAWRDTPAIDVATVQRFGPSTGAPILVQLRSVHTGGDVFFAASWSDATESRAIKPWLWNASAGRYEEGPEREDMFAIALPLAGPFDADMLAPVESSWDVWQWKACRTDPAGFAMDKTSQHMRTQPAGKAAAYPARDGRTLWIARPDDAGDPLYVKRPAPAEFEGERIEQYVPTRATGSAADVRAKAQWVDGRWTLELSRRLTTGHDDDTALAIGTELPIAIAVFDARGEMDRGSDEIALVLAERRR